MPVVTDIVVVVGALVVGGTVGGEVVGAGMVVVTGVADRAGSSASAEHDTMRVALSAIRAVVRIIMRRLRSRPDRS
jgi:hypothetical protein